MLQYVDSNVKPRLRCSLLDPIQWIGVAPYQLESDYWRRKRNNNGVDVVRAGSRETWHAATKSKITVTCRFYAILNAGILFILFISSSDYNTPELSSSTLGTQPTLEARYQN